MVQKIEFGTVLLLRQSDVVSHCRSERFTQLLGRVGNPLNCIHGTVRDRRKLETPNVSALVVAGWFANEEGLAIIRDIRARFPTLRILVVGAADTEITRISAYEAGVDNFVSGACSEREFLAHLKCLLRRHEQVEEAILISDLTVWTGPRVVMRSGRPVKLSAKEMELLLYLVENRSHPVSRARILKHVFGLSFEPGTNIVEVHIHRLRQKIDSGNNTPLLKTIRGVGYILDQGDDESRQPPTIVPLGATAAHQI